ncbi:hypothetical protein ES754_01355 [Psychrobacter frigidicola]|uniref:Uncharacterized protein n=1 Tax=Psychrobacter frigidicola TaxID=45611 RepID=A0A5C7A4X6_9GAMM|nr:hypothetical protein [Psychrobacter frigidicola]TXD97660.1 hypothetical protein ES754_01355 [Psychrobacter frigidicola]
MSNSKTTDDNKYDDTKHEDTKRSDSENSKDDKGSDTKDDEDVSLVETATTTAKDVVGSMADKAADGMEFAAEKIKEARKQD